MSCGAMPVPTDRGDARGPAELISLGWFRAVRVKTRQAQQWRLLLTKQCLLVTNLVSGEAEIRGNHSPRAAWRVCP